MATRRQDSAPAYKEQVLLEQALEALRQGTGLIGQVAALNPPVESGIRADAAVELNADGQRYGYLVQIRGIDRFAALAQVRNQFDSFPRPGLLVAPRITPEVADQCRRLGVQFVDAQGNAYLRAPGLWVWVKGQRARPGGEDAVAAMDTARGGTAAALRVVFALLCRPQLLNASHREINQAAGVALGAVGGVLSDLGQRGYILGAKAGSGRRWLERRRLIDEWAVQYPVVLRPKLNPRRFQGLGMDWRQLDVARYGMQWGGEAAADRLTGHLKPGRLTLYARPEDLRQNLTRLVAENRLRADPRGDIEVLEAFWNFPPDPGQPDTVPPLLVYADLLATLDPRNLEVARLIHERWIDASDVHG